MGPADRSIFPVVLWLDVIFCSFPFRTSLSWLAGGMARTDCPVFSFSHSIFVHNIVVGPTSMGFEGARFLIFLFDTFSFPFIPSTTQAVGSIIGRQFGMASLAQPMGWMSNSSVWVYLCRLLSIQYTRTLARRLFGICVFEPFPLSFHF